VVLRDRSLSMDRPERTGAGTRAAAAERAISELRGALRGRVRLEEQSFASGLLADSARGTGERSASAPGSALTDLARLPVERRPDGVILVTDGAVNAGDDPVAAARALGVPVHGLLVGESTGAGRGIAGVEASSEARVGEATPVNVRVVSGEERGTPIEVRLEDEGRVLARATVPAPGPGAEATAELRVTPSRAGLAFWTARLAPLAGDTSADDDAHGVVVPVAPGKLGILIVSDGLNWDLTFLRRALAGDSTVELDTRVREAAGWRAIESARAGVPSDADLTGRSVVVLDGVSGAELGPAFDAALARFVRAGGGLLLLAGGPPGPRDSRRDSSRANSRSPRRGSRRHRWRPNRRPPAPSCWRGTTTPRAARVLGARPHHFGCREHRTRRADRVLLAARDGRPAAVGGARRGPRPGATRERRRRVALVAECHRRPRPASAVAGCGGRRCAGSPNPCTASRCASPPSEGSCRG
jgi:hypothetical protein